MNVRLFYPFMNMQRSELLAHFNCSLLSLKLWLFYHNFSLMKIQPAKEWAHILIYLNVFYNNIPWSCSNCRLVGPTFGFRWNNATQALVCVSFNLSVAVTSPTIQSDACLCFHNTGTESLGFFLTLLLSHAPDDVCIIYSLTSLNYSWCFL